MTNKHDTSKALAVSASSGNSSPTDMDKWGDIGDLSLLRPPLNAIIANMCPQELKSVTLTRPNTTIGLLSS
eukprot:5806808-Amphidinium_carterae.1